MNWALQGLDCPKANPCGWALTRDVYWSELWLLWTRRNRWKGDVLKAALYLISIKVSFRFPIIKQYVNNSLINTSFKIYNMCHISKIDLSIQNLYCSFFVSLLVCAASVIAVSIKKRWSRFSIKTLKHYEKREGSTIQTFERAKWIHLMKTPISFLTTKRKIKNKIVEEERGKKTQIRPLDLRFINTWYVRRWLYCATEATTGGVIFAFLACLATLHWQEDGRGCVWTKVVHAAALAVVRNI